MILDIVVLAVLLISALIAFLRGFIRETLTIVGVAGGLAAAYAGGPSFAPVMRSWMGVVPGEDPQKLFDIVPYPILADLLAYASIFIVVVIVLSIMSHFLAETVKSVGLGAIDRTFGVIFGLARGVLVLGILYMPAHLIFGEEDKDRWFEGSRTFFYLEKTAEAMVGFLPSDAVADLEEKTRAGAEEALSTREKLQQIELLKKEGQNGDPSSPDQNGDGYSDEFRNKMDRLFEDRTQNGGNQ